MNTNDGMLKSPQEAQQEYQKKKKDFEASFVEFHKKVFLNKVLDSNKSAAVKNTERHIIDKLVNSAVALDNVNNGEGLLALSTLTLRELLGARDRINELEYHLYKMIKEMNNIKKELGISDVKGKK